jgi:hypothetical protein
MMQVDIQPGQRIRVRQTIARREGAWSGETVGTVLSIEAEPTESWFAHSRDNKLWLRRLRLRKDDGELTTLTLDQHSDVTVLGDRGYD